MTESTSFRPSRYLLGLIPLGIGLLAAVPLESIEAGLGQVQSTRQVPEDFKVVYDDMHALHGGLTITILGDGTASMTEKLRGPQPPTVTEHKATSEELLSLVDLLVELKAWEQRTPDRLAVPDESKGTLAVSLGDQQGGFWEWYNDMGQNDRLVRIQRQMKTMATPETEQ